MDSAITASRRREQWPKSISPVLAEIAAVTLVMVVCLVIALPRWRSGIDWGDEGFLAYGAIRVMEGQVPNRDFVSLQPPLSFYTAAALFKMLGASVVSLRILGSAIYLAIALLIYAISRSVTNQIAAVAAALSASVIGLPYFYFAPIAVWQGITASLFAIFVYEHAVLRAKPSLGWAAGVFTAASLLLRHDQGLYLFLSIAAFSLTLRRVRDEPQVREKASPILVCWLAGIAIVLLPIGIYWWVVGTLPQMFKQLIVFPLTIYGETSSLPFHYFSWQLPFSRNAVTTLYYLPLVIELIAIVLLIRRILRRGVSLSDAFVILLVIWSGLFYCQVLTRSDIFHLMMALPPFFVLSASVWSDVLKNLNAFVEARVQSDIVQKLAGFGVPALSVILLISFLCAIAPVCLPNVTRAKTPLALRRGGIRLENAQTVADVVHTVQQHVPPERSILSLPYQPMLYFLCERRNPTRWNYLWPGDQTPQDHQTLIQEAKGDPPAAVLIFNEQRMATYAPAILDYIHTEFRPTDSSPGLTLYLPRDHQTGVPTSRAP